MSQETTMKCDGPPSGGSCLATVAMSGGALPDGWHEVHVVVRKGSGELHNKVLHLCEDCYEALESGTPMLNFE